VPLTGLEAPMPSFPFTDLHHDLKQPPPRVLHQFVMVLVARFHMSVAEIVMAYALVRPHTPHNHPTARSPYPSPKHQSPRNFQVEQARFLSPDLVRCQRCYSVRLIFLGCCVLACKMTREHDISLTYLQSLLEDVFNLLEVGLLIRIEHQTREVLSLQPAPHPQPRLRAYVAPFPLPQCDAGARLWRLPMGAGQYQEYADAIFCAAADALLAPPMQAPQVLSPWLSPVESTVLVDGLPMWQGALRLAPQTSARSPPFPMRRYRVRPRSR